MTGAAVTAPPAALAPLARVALEPPAKRARTEPSDTLVPQQPHKAHEQDHKQQQVGCCHPQQQPVDSYDWQQQAAAAAAIMAVGVQQPPLWQQDAEAARGITLLQGQQKQQAWPPNHLSEAAVAAATAVASGVCLPLRQAGPTNAAGGLSSQSGPKGLKALLSFVPEVTKPTHAARRPVLPPVLLVPAAGKRVQQQQSFPQMQQVQQQRAGPPATHALPPPPQQQQQQRQQQQQKQQDDPLRRSHILQQLQQLQRQQQRQADALPPHTLPQHPPPQLQRTQAAPPSPQPSQQQHCGPVAPLVADVPLSAKLLATLPRVHQGVLQQRFPILPDLCQVFDSWGSLLSQVGIPAVLHLPPVTLLGAAQWLLQLAPAHQALLAGLHGELCLMLACVASMYQQYSEKLGRGKELLSELARHAVQQVTDSHGVAERLRQPPTVPLHQVRLALQAQCWEHLQQQQPVVAARLVAEGQAKQGQRTQQPPQQQGQQQGQQQQQQQQQQAQQAQQAEAVHLQEAAKQLPLQAQAQAQAQGPAATQGHCAARTPSPLPAAKVVPRMASHASSQAPTASEREHTSSGSMHSGQPGQQAQAQPQPQPQPQQQQQQQQQQAQQQSEAAALMESVPPTPAPAAAGAPQGPMVAATPVERQVLQMLRDDPAVVRRFELYFAKQQADGGKAAQSAQGAAVVTAGGDAGGKIEATAAEAAAVPLSAPVADASLGSSGGAQREAAVVVPAQQKQQQQQPEETEHQQQQQEQQTEHQQQQQIAAKFDAAGNAVCGAAGQPGWVQEAEQRMKRLAKLLAA